MRELIVEPEAEAELAEAMAWYEEQGPGLGAALLVEVDEAIGRLREGAWPSSPVPGVRGELGVRRVVLDRFPYSVIFLEHDDCIAVIAFPHLKRVPGYWLERIEDED